MYTMLKTTDEMNDVYGVGIHVAAIPPQKIRATIADAVVFCRFV